MPVGSTKQPSGLYGAAIGNNIVDAKLDVSGHLILQQRVCGLTNIGRGREKNQDAASAYLYYEGNLPCLILTVADGLGAYVHSEEAAYYAVTEIPRALGKGKDFAESFEGVHRELVKILYRSEESRDRGCTTAILAKITGNRVDVANAGDSRGYLIRGKKIVYQSRDQSMMELLMEEGKVSDPLIARRHPLRNVVLNSLGSPEPSYQFYEKGKLVLKRAGIPIVDELQLKNGDYLFLASDGLFTNLSDNEIIQLITQTPWEKLVETLSTTMQKVFKTGSTSLHEEPNPDNYTFVVYRHLGTL